MNHLQNILHYVTTQFTKLNNVHGSVQPSTVSDSQSGVYIVRLLPHYIGQFAVKSVHPLNGHEVVSLTYSTALIYVSTTTPIETLIN